MILRKMTILPFILCFIVVGIFGTLQLDNVSCEEREDIDADEDGDGLSDQWEIEHGTDSHRKSMYEDDPIVFAVNTDPEKPTALNNISLLVHVAAKDRNVAVTLHYRTLTEKYREIVMEPIAPERWGLQNIMELQGKDYTEDDFTVAYHLEFWARVAEGGEYSTGEIFTCYLNITYDGGYGHYPDKGYINFELKPEIEIVDGMTGETVLALIFALFFGSIASKRMRNRLSRVSYTDIQWWDAVNRKAFVKVIKIFRDVNEVKQVLKRLTGKMIRFLYFTGITGLLMLAFELLVYPKEISQLSLVIIGLLLLFTVISPVIYVYFSRWKYKNPRVGKIRILFFFLFPPLIAIFFKNEWYVEGYVLIFMFLYSIPMLLYGNLMGSNWNFLIFNSLKEFSTGFDHLTNSPSGPIKRIYAFFFFLVIFLMPILALNSLFSLFIGTYEEGGPLGIAADQMIRNFGYDYYAQLFSKFIAIFIILNVLLLGVAMVFRVIQLQFYASQKFTGRLGFGFKHHFKLRNNQEEQRNLIASSFFVFFGYSVLLLLLAIYSQIAYLLPTVPGFSEEILKTFLYYQSVLANMVFVFFWFVSLPMIGKMFRMKRVRDGFVIPK